MPEAQIRVRGKGNKTRFLPLAPEAAQLLDHYLRLERPANSSTALFVSLQGSARGARMTPAGLRSLFRHHRQTSGVKIANPHRFRHTFASDMVRAGVSLPALMQLMGHANIQTTLVYMQVTPLEVYQQYARAIAQHVRPVPLSRLASVDHPLALQFQRAVESLTAAQVWDSARQYRGTARNFLIYLGENHPDVASLSQLRRDPHILGWFTHLRSLAPAVYINRLTHLRRILEELAWEELAWTANFTSWRI